MIRRFLPFLFIAAVQVVFAQEVRTVTLEQALAEALESNYSVKIARNVEQISVNNVNYEPFLPSLGLTGRQSQTHNNSRVNYTEGDPVREQKNTVDNASAGVSLSWRLFDGMSMFVTYDRNRELRKQGELKLRGEVEKLIADVTNQFYGVIILEQRLEAARYYLEISQLRYNQAKEKYVIGSISGLEMKQAKIDFNADSSQLIVDELAVRNAYVELAKLISSDCDVRFKASGEIDPDMALDLKELKENTMERNVDLLLSRSGETIADKDLRLVRSLRFPTLDFSTGYSYSFSKNPISVAKYNSTTGYNWGFSLSYNIFSGTEVNRRIKNAKIAIDNSRLDYQQTELSVMNDLTQTYNTYRNNIQMMGFERENAEVARTNLEAAMDMYRIGTLSGTDFREIQRSYMAAEIRRLLAVYQAKISEISLLFLSGELIR